MLPPNTADGGLSPESPPSPLATPATERRSIGEMIARSEQRMRRESAWNGTGRSSSCQNHAGADGIALQCPPKHGFSRSAHG